MLHCCGIRDVPSREPLEEHQEEIWLLLVLGMALEETLALTLCWKPREKRTRVQLRISSEQRGLLGPGSAKHLRPEPKKHPSAPKLKYGSWKRDGAKGQPSLCETNKLQTNCCGLQLAQRQTSRQVVPALPERQPQLPPQPRRSLPKQPPHTPFVLVAPQGAAPSAAPALARAAAHGCCPLFLTARRGDAPGSAGSIALTQTGLRLPVAQAQRVLPAGRRRFRARSDLGFKAPMKCKHT